MASFLRGTETCGNNREPEVVTMSLREMNSDHRIRVLTLNLWQRYGDWTARRNVLIDGLCTLNPHIASFAESIKTPDYDQAADLVGPGFNVIHSKTRDHNGMGISIASRWPIQDFDELDLEVKPRTVEFPCATLAAEVVAPEPIGPFLFVNHFPNWQLDFERERESQAVAASRFIEDLVAKRRRQVIMVGDLDADPNAASIRFWTGRQSLDGMSVCYRDAWESVHANDPGHTFTPENPLVKEQIVKGMKPFRDWPFRRIDYIFVRLGSHGGNALDVLDCQRIFDEPINGVWVSDHFGLVADLAKPDLPSQGTVS